MNPEDRFDYGTWGDGQLWKSFPITGFMGDSITHEWETPAPRSLNYGIPSNTTVQMLNRMNDLLSKKPRVINILGGLNDIAHVPNATTANILEMALMAKDLGCKVILGKVLPNSYWTNEYEYHDWSTGNAAILAWNVSLVEMGKKHGFPVVDYYTPMLSGSYQNTSLFLDGMHPNDDGYDVMDCALEPILEAVGG